MVHSLSTQGQLDFFKRVIANELTNYTWLSEGMRKDLGEISKTPRSSEKDLEKVVLLLIKKLADFQRTHDANKD